MIKSNRKFAEKHAGRLCLYRGYGVEIIGYLEGEDDVIIITGCPYAWDQSLLSERHIILADVRRSAKFRCIYINEITIEK